MDTDIDLKPEPGAATGVDGSGAGGALILSSQFRLSD
jgi:hypothetical protein